MIDFLNEGVMKCNLIIDVFNIPEKVELLLCVSYCISSITLTY